MVVVWGGALLSNNHHPNLLINLFFCVNFILMFNSCRYFGDPTTSTTTILHPQEANQVNETSRSAFIQMWSMRTLFTPRIDFLAIISGRKSDLVQLKSFQLPPQADSVQTHTSTKTTSSSACFLKLFFFLCFSVFVQKYCSFSRFCWIYRGKKVIFTWKKWTFEKDFRWFLHQWDQFLSFSSGSNQINSGVDYSPCSRPSLAIIIDFIDRLKAEEK